MPGLAAGRRKKHQRPGGLSSFLPVRRPLEWKERVLEQGGESSSIYPAESEFLIHVLFIAEY
jgi:hypothetical protein